MPTGQRPEPDPTQLRWRRDRLERELRAQAEKADGFAEELELADAQTRAAYLDDLDAWNQRTRTIIEQAFTGRSELTRFDPPRAGMVITSPDESKEEQRQQRIASAIERFFSRRRHLKSLLDRLDVFEPDEDGGPGPPRDGQTVFLVHGRDDARREAVARALHRLTGRDPVILDEQTSRGRTVIEKFEEHASSAGAAVVILSPDDEGRLAGAGRDLAPRARQNVVYELGWFHARLGRDRVIALLVDAVERPSDIAGVIYIAVDSARRWQHDMGKELAEMGITVDLGAV